MKALLPSTSMMELKLEKSWYIYIEEHNESYIIVFSSDKFFLEKAIKNKKEPKRYYLPIGDEMILSTVFLSEKVGIEFPDPQEVYFWKGSQCPDKDIEIHLVGEVDHELRKRAYQIIEGFMSWVE